MVTEWVLYRCCLQKEFYPFTGKKNNNMNYNAILIFYSKMICICIDRYEE